MTPQPVAWNDIAHILRLLVVVFRDEGRTAVPPHDETPTAALETLCDEWCRKLAADIRDPQLPPPELRSWILARTVSAHAFAESLAETHDPRIIHLSKALIEELLIHQWHHQLRADWALLMELPDVE